MECPKLSQYISSVIYYHIRDRIYKLVFRLIWRPYCLIMSYFNYFNIYQNWNVLEIFRDQHLDRKRYTHTQWCFLRNRKKINFNAKNQLFTITSYITAYLTIFRNSLLKSTGFLSTKLHRKMTIIYKQESP